MLLMAVELLPFHEFHFVKDALLAFLHVGTGMLGAELAGIGQRDGYQCTLGLRQL